MSSVLDPRNLAGEKFRNAVRALETAVKEHKQWSTLTIALPELDNLVAPELDPESVAKEVEKVLEKAQKATKKPQTLSWLQKMKDTLKQFFRSSFHFTQVLLMIMKEASQVCPIAFTAEGSFHF